MGNHREKNNKLVIIINLWLMEEVEHDSKNWAWAWLLISLKYVRLLHFTSTTSDAYENILQVNLHIA